MSTACDKNAPLVITQATQMNITSPNWPNPYPSPSNCTWEVIALAGVNIQLTVKGHHIAEQYVYIY